MPSIESLCLPISPSHQLPTAGWVATNQVEVEHRRFLKRNSQRPPTRVWHHGMWLAFPCLHLSIGRLCATLCHGRSHRHSNSWRAVTSRLRHVTRLRPNLTACASGQSLHRLRFGNTNPPYDAKEAHERCIFPGIHTCQRIILFAQISCQPTG